VALLGAGFMSQLLNDSPKLSYKDKADTTASLGVFQSPTGGYVSRRQRYGSSTTNPGRGALVAIESMSWSTVLC